MTRLEQEIHWLRQALAGRNQRGEWGRIYRHFARQALGEIRYLTNRPRKNLGRNCHYGHQT